MQYAVRGRLLPGCPSAWLGWAGLQMCPHTQNASQYGMCGREAREREMMAREDGLRWAAIDGALFDSVKTGTEMVFDANTRGTRRMRHNADDFFEIVDQLKEQGVVAGKPPSIVPIYSSTFPNGSDSGPSGVGPARDGYASKQREFVAAFFARNNSCLCDNPSGCDSVDQTADYQSLYLGAYVLASLHKDQSVIATEIAKVAVLPAAVRHRITTKYH